MTLPNRQPPRKHRPRGVEILHEDRDLLVVNKAPGVLTTGTRRDEAFTAENVRSIRPGHGLHPRHLPDILGRTAARSVARGTPLAWDLIVKEHGA